MLSNMHVEVWSSSQVPIFNVALVDLLKIYKLIFWTKWNIGKVWLMKYQHLESTKTTMCKTFLPTWIKVNVRLHNRKMVNFPSSNFTPLLPPPLVVHILDVFLIHTSNTLPCERESKLWHMMVFTYSMDSNLQPSTLVNQPWLLNDQFNFVSRLQEP